MIIKRTAIAAVFALVASSVQAVTLLNPSNSGQTFNFEQDVFFSLEINISADPFTDGQPGASYNYTFQNTFTNTIEIMSFTRIIQLGDDAFFTDGASVSWSGPGDTVSAAQGITEIEGIGFLLAPGASNTVSIQFGDTVKTEPDIFTDELILGLRIEADLLPPVPLPGALPMLLVGLAGFGISKRRQKG